MYLSPEASRWSFTGSFNPEVEPFHRSLPDYAVTPLVSLPDVAKDLGLKHVFMKDESNRLGLPAFKILGASWAVYKAVAEKCNVPPGRSVEEVGKAAKAQGIRLVTCTEGNWGRAVSRMAKYLSITATVFVPDFMDLATQKKIEGEGGNVIVVDGDYDDSVRYAQDEAEKGGLLVMDVAYAGYEQIPKWVVEGYKTMLAEVDTQLKELHLPSATHAIAGVGAGSWAESVAAHYKAKSPTAKFIAVEPTEAASLKSSLEAGKITSIKTGHTIMNGLNCGTTSLTAWEVLKHGVDASLTVTDVDVHHDLLYLHGQGVKNGPCGASTLSALRKACQEEREALGLDEKSVVILYSTEGVRDYIIPDGA